MIFSIWAFYRLTFKCGLDLQVTWSNVLNEQLCQIILKSMHKCRSYGADKLNLSLFFSFDLQVWPWPSTYLNKCFKPHFYSSRTTTSGKLFLNPCINVQVMAQTNPDDLASAQFWGILLKITIRLSHWSPNLIIHSISNFSPNLPSQSFKVSKPTELVL